MDRADAVFVSVAPEESLSIEGRVELRAKLQRETNSGYELLDTETLRSSFYHPPNTGSAISATTQRIMAFAGAARAAFYARSRRNKLLQRTQSLSGSEVQKSERKQLVESLRQVGSTEFISSIIDAEEGNKSD